MNPVVAAFIASISCNSPAMEFRPFYAHFYHNSGSGEHWAGSRGEFTETVQKRLADALADYVEYRVSIMDKCK